MMLPTGMGHSQCLSRTFRKTNVPCLSCRPNFIESRNRFFKRSICAYERGNADSQPGKRTRIYPMQVVQVWGKAKSLNGAIDEFINMGG